MAADNKTGQKSARVGGYFSDASIPYDRIMDEAKDKCGCDLRERTVYIP